MINTTLQLALPCIDDIKILASVTDDPVRDGLPTMGELAPALSLALWNGLFVTKDTGALVY